MPTVLVTGAAGFIGSNLCEKLLAEGRNVVGVDNFLTGHQKNIAPLLSESQFTFYDADIRSYEEIEQIIKKHAITHISHQAARASVPKSVENPLLTNEININGTLNLLDIAKNHQLEKFVCAISSSIYGDTPVLPKVETMPYDPLSPYAITKAAKEMYCKVFYQLYGLPTIGLRYFNVYGRKQDPQGAYAAVIPRWIQAAAQGEDLILNGAGLQTRDFTYIDDVVDANYLALTCTNSDAYGKGYNICYGERTPITKLAETIITKMNSSSKVVHGPERPGDIQDSLGDITRAKQLLGYNPTISIEKGIELTIDWYAKHSDYFTHL